MAKQGDYTTDDDLKLYLEDARKSGFGKQLLAKNANDLHLLVATQADPRPVYGMLQYASVVRDQLNEQDADGMTPLMYAATDQKGDMATLLRTAGASANLQNNDGETALQIYDESYNRGPENGDDPNLAAEIRAAFEGGRRRRRKTRARKTKRRQTRRRR